MPTDHIVSLLIAERDRLNRAIEALGAPLKRRGRPPKNPAPVATAVAVPAVAVPAEAPAAPKRRPRTAAQRKVQAERMKAYWARRRKEEKKGYRPSKALLGARPRNQCGRKFLLAL